MPITAEDTLRATRVVVLHMLQDAFDLIPEERTWADYRIEQAMAMLAGYMPVAIPIPVRQEMLARTYSTGLAVTDTATGNAVSTAVWRDEVTTASAEDWAAALTEVVRVTFQPSTDVDTLIRAKFATILRELGVGDDSNPRGSQYLPNVVRERLASRPVAAR